MCKDCGLVVCEKILEKDSWIKIQDRLPEIGEKVLVSDGSFIDIGVRHYLEWYFSTGYWIKEPTYWMPIPSIPEER